ncbi:glycerol-3-phosphate dehydrogenase/oxidase [Panacibacter ginsenosidivorans]|uniref:Glycerol-3-phosphate dehydrogenase/oxidase n=1 Tax=Panacibacter ginsenosidivorans TaxID=1813871 RepID=A0A5B8VAS5_9BACT|nr:glycerol-3-phosphate dehydrogenase/oxidase [Panacibacter ginsenosidivorans]QEC67796.1 glycerol-3-phosphate dehydrogenase/oxidase [Panacibacter ginsenosidivorans]
MNRDEMLQQLQQTTEWDIVIIGGGATGLGAAVDATTRGYKTLLIEAYDFGKGTSSRSTKLVHGGVRYLAQGNIKLVMEALRERGYLLKNAPHITSASPFIVPAYSWFDKFFYGVGLKVYDIMAGKLSLGKTRLLNKKETLQQLPGVSDKNLKGGILYYDGQFDDARLAIDLAVTAAKHGGAILNYCKVNALVKENGKIKAVILEDTINKKVYKVNAQIVINATGVFTDDIMQMDEPENDMLVSPSQGIHLVVDRKFFPGTNALMIPKTDDGRVLFAVPWHDKVVLGTTDTPVDNISFEPRPLEEEIEFVLHHANRYLAQHIQRSDVRSAYAGLRPLVKQKGAKNTALISRDHTIIVSKANLVTITGGKWTTYRKMAEDVVNNAAFAAKLSKKSCVTKQLPIGDTKKALSKNGDTFLHSAFTYTEADIIHFAKHEMAVTVEDVLSRRTRILLLDAKAATEAAPFVAKILAEVMNKDAQWINEQVNAFTELANNYKL